MAQTVSVAAREAMMRGGTDIVPALLIRISPPAGDPTENDPRWPLRVAAHPTDVTSKGLVYAAKPDIYWRQPDDEGEGEPEFTLVIPGATQGWIDLFRALEDPPTLQMDLVILDPDDATPTTQDTVSFDWVGLTVRDVKAIDGIEIKCRYETLVDSPFPQYRYSPSEWPGTR